MIIILSLCIMAINILAFKYLLNIIILFILFNSGMQYMHVYKRTLMHTTKPNIKLYFLIQYFSQAFAQIELTLC